MNGNETRPLEDWLRAAYAGCPPPEAFLAAERAALEPAERRRLDDHAEGCPACAAERDLARLFDAGSRVQGAADVRPEDVRYVVSRLEAASPLGGQVVPFVPRSRHPRSTRRFPALARLAAAAVVVLAAGLLGQRLLLAPPPLPSPPSAGGVFRGGELELLAPVGELPSAPAELRWEPRPGAAAYRIRLRAVDGEVLWEENVTAPPARLPAAATRRLVRAVAYSWSVEALDPRGARLAGSEPAQFRIRPTGEGSRQQP